MFKSIFITTLISTTLLIADNSFLGKMISKGTQYQQVKKHKTKKIKKFKKDNHKYNKRYRNFDYDRYGYYNDDGFYFGYFDRDGYFFNNLYFEYNSRYTYRDRYYRRGYFAPSYHHNRICNYNNEWNRVHRYREPNIIVYGNYYENYQPQPYRGDYSYRSSHYYRDKGRVINHRFSNSNSYRNSNHIYNKKSKKRGILQITK